MYTLTCLYVHIYARLHVYIYDHAIMKPIAFYAYHKN